MKTCTKEDLIKFEEWCVAEYHKGNVRSPVHLSGSVDGKLEDFLIEIFKEVKPQDWVFTTYRSHFHALLKGVPQDWLKKWILENKSIHLMNKEHKIVSSAIVGGTLSQAVGCAMAIKRKSLSREWSDEAISKSGESETFQGEYPVNSPTTTHVWVFCGDMTASLGIFHDCIKYSFNNKLPITFIIENNLMSTDTPSFEAWGMKEKEYSEELKNLTKKYPHIVKYHQYKRRYPHYGTGKRIDFKENMT